MEYGKTIYAMEVVDVEEVDVVEEELLAIRITHTTPVMVLIPERFLGISAVPNGMLFRDMVEHMLAVGTSKITKVIKHMGT